MYKKITDNNFVVEQYTPAEIKIFKKLNSPKKIQDFLEGLRVNFEKRGDTCYSPRMVLKHHKAHCMEGAMLAAAALEFHGRPPLVLDLRAIDEDFDHVIAPFRRFGCWGSISKTNHAVLRYREPVYKTIRELVLSFFHEYFDDTGKKTLREYSKPFDLKYFDKHPLPSPPHKITSLLPSREWGTPIKGEGKRREDWRTSPNNLFAIPDYLDEIKHYKILNRRQIKNLRKADKIEIQAGKLVEYKK